MNQLKPVAAASAAAALLALFFAGGYFIGAAHEQRKTMEVMLAAEMRSAGAVQRQLSLGKPEIATRLLFSNAAFNAWLLLDFASHRGGHLDEATKNWCSFYESAYSDFKPVIESTRNAAPSEADFKKLLALCTEQS